MSISFNELLKMDELEDKQYWRQMKGLFEIIMKASDDEAKKISIYIDMLSSYGSRRKTHLKLKRFVRIRKHQQRVIDKKSWWQQLFTSPKKNSDLGWWTEVHCQYKKAMQQEKQQFNFAVSQFKRTVQHKWQLFEQMFKRTIKKQLAAFCKIQLPFWLRQIRPRQLAFLEEKAKKWLQQFEKVYWFEKWLILSDKEKYNKSYIFETRKKEEFIRSMLSRYYDQSDQFINTITSWLLQQWEQEKQQSKRLVEKQKRQLQIKFQVQEYFLYQKLIRRRHQRLAYHQKLEKWQDLLVQIINLLSSQYREKQYKLEMLYEQQYQKDPLLTCEEKGERQTSEPSSFKPKTQ